MLINLLVDVAAILLIVVGIIFVVALIYCLLEKP